MNDHDFTNYLLTDELRSNNYNDEFIDNLKKYIQIGKLERNDYNGLINCLIEIDEIREECSYSIKKIIFHAITNNINIDIIISILKDFNNKYNFSKFHLEYFSNLIDKVIDGNITIKDLLLQLKKAEE